MKKKILLVNEGYSDNLGDQAIKDSLIFLLGKEENNRIMFSDFTKNLNFALEIDGEKGDSSNTGGFLKNIVRLLFPVKLRWLLANFLRINKVAKQDFDLVIIGGGQLILSNDTFSVAMLLWTFLLRFYSNKRIVLFGVGVGDSFSFIDKNIYKYVLNNVDNIFVRDDRSKNTLKTFFKVHSKFIYDVAFAYSFTGIRNVNPLKGGKVLLGVVSIKVYHQYNKKNLSLGDYYETWIQLLNKKNIRLEQVSLFYTTKDDKRESKSFQKYVEKKYKFQIPLLETNTLKKLTFEINKSQKIVSGRMHALILAISYEKQIATYVISGKLEEFKRMFEEDTVDIKLINSQINQTISSII